MDKSRKENVLWKEIDEEFTFPISPTTDISCSFLLPSANIQRSRMPREPFSNSTITYALSIISGTCRNKESEHATRIGFFYAYEEKKRKEIKKRGPIMVINVLFTTNDPFDELQLIKASL